MFDTICEALKPLKVDIFDEDATGAQADFYFLILGATDSRGLTDNVAGTLSETSVIIRAVGVNAAHARAMLFKARLVLRGLSADNGKGTRYVFRWDGCPRPAVVDREYRVPGTNRHPVFIDDEYTVYGSAQCG